MIFYLLHLYSRLHFCKLQIWCFFKFTFFYIRTAKLNLDSTVEIVEGEVLFVNFWLKKFRIDGLKYLKSCVFGIYPWNLPINCYMYDEVSWLINIYAKFANDSDLITNNFWQARVAVG